MKFQLKRSDQLTQGGTALTPDGQYLEFGEIAINYNATDPAIFFKDTQNNVIRISGVGAQIGSGDITLTAGSGISISTPNSFNLQDSYDTNITISVNQGTGSGLDADTVDGIHAASFLRSDANDTYSGLITGNQLHLGGSQITNSSASLQVNGFSRQGTIYLHDLTNGVDSPLKNVNGELIWNTDVIWHAGNDGSGSGLDADLLDGSQGSSYLRSDATDQYDGQTSGRVMRFRCVDGRNAGSSNGSLFPLEVFQNSNTTNSDAAMTFHIGGRYATYFGLDRETNDLFTGGWSDGSTKHKIWHAGNDGASSGLDADLLDGQQGSYYRNASNLNTGTIPDARIPDTITPVTLVQTKEIRTSNGTEVVINAGEAAGKFSGQTGEYIYTNAEHGLLISTSGGNSNFQSGWYPRQTLINGEGIHFYFSNELSPGTHYKIGEITTTDNTWLRINQNTAKNIYTPRYIRADGGFFVDGTSKGINGSGNFVGGTIAGASDYGTLLRSNANDTATGELTFNGKVNIRTGVDFADGDYVYFGSSDDAIISFNSNNWLYMNFKGNGLVMQDNGSDKMIFEDSGVIRPSATNTGTIGTSSRYWDNGYFQDFNISSNLTVQNRIYVGSSDNGQAIEVDRSSSYNTHLYIGGWSSSNSNNIARIRCSNNLHIDSPANGHIYFNWYSKKNINYKGPLLGGDTTSTCRPTNGSESAPGLSFAGDSDTGFYRGANNRINFSTGGAFRGFMAGSDFRFSGIYSATVSGGTNVRVDSNGRLRRHSSSRRTKTNIEPMEADYAYNILNQVEPIWYRPRVPDPNYPQEYLDNLLENESPSLADCEAYCQDNKIKWEIGDAWMNEGCNPNWSYWGFIAEDIAEIDPRLCQQNPDTGEYDSVQYEEFTPLLLKIAQEQKKTITSLEERLTALEQKFAQCSACDS